MVKKRMNKEEVLLVLKKNKVWRPILAGMATAVLILLILCGIKAKEMKKVENTNLVVSEMENNKEDMIHELTNVSSYLDTLDQSVVTNKEALDELTTYSTDVEAKVEELENSVTEIERMFEEYLLNHESVSEDVKVNITGITDELQMVKEDIALSKQELTSFMEEVRSTDTEQTDSVIYEINTVEESLEENKKELALIYERIVSVMDVLTITEERNHAELIAMLTKAEQELNTLLTEEMASLAEIFTKSNEEMHILVEENVVKLSEKMTSLHNEIVDAKGDIAALLEEMKMANAENQKEMETAFLDIRATV